MTWRGGGWNYRQCSLSHEILDFNLLTMCSCTKDFCIAFKWRGTLLHEGYLYFFFHPKWSKLCIAPLVSPENPPIKKNLKKIIFDLLYDPLKMWFFARFTLFLGYINPFFSSKMDQTLHSPSYGSKIPPYLKKFKKMYLTPYLDPLKMWHFACFTLFQGVC